MQKQNQRTLTRTKARTGSSLKTILSIVFVVAGSISIGLWIGFVRSVRDKAKPIVDKLTAAQKLRGVEVKAIHRKQAEAGVNPSAPLARSEEHDTVDSSKQLLILATEIGDITITLRPDLSPESVQYILNLFSVGCANCKLYRAEKPGILQGIIANRQKVPVSKVKGLCPPGYEHVKNNCPEWDKSCACHGPEMTRGMVAWAAGDTGPDFFIDNYKRKADWWGTQHTVWGEIQDAASFAVIDKIWALPTHSAGDLIMLNKEITFDLILSSAIEHDSGYTNAHL